MVVSHVSTPWCVGAVVLAGLLPACDCLGGGENVADAKAAIRVVEAVALDATAIGLRSTAQVLVENPGTDLLVISSTEMVGDDAPAFSATLTSPEALPSGATTLNLAFHPGREGPHEATLILRSNAFLAEETRITLTSTGLPGALDVTPLTVDFGTVTLDQQRSQVLTLQNRTGQLVSVTARVVDDPGRAFVLPAAGTGDATTVGVPGSGSVTLEVVFAPLQGGRHAGVVELSYCGPGCGLRVPMVGVLAAPRITASPIAVDFGRSQRDVPVAASVTVGNLGALPLELALPVVSPPGAFDLDGATDFPRTVAPGETTTVPVRYLAAGAGRVDAFLQLSSNDPRTPQARLALTGTTGGPDVTAVPGALQFGTVFDDTARAGDLLLVNRGDEPASVLSLTLQDAPEGGTFFLAAEPAFPHVLAPGGVLSLGVFYAGQQAGTHRGTLALQTTSAGRAEVVVPVEGTRADRGCLVVTDPPEVMFGPVRVGQQSLRHATLRNAGTASCQLGPARSSSLYGANTAFVFSSMGGALAPGATTAIAVRFTPRAAGTVRSVAEVDVTGQPTVRISARGSGTDASLSANPAFVDFGEVPANCGSAQRNVTLTSDGSTPVTVRAPLVSPAPPFGASNAGFPVTLSPGQARSFTVTFSPASTGEFNGTAILDTTEVVALSLVIGLRGTGVPMSTPRTERFTVATRASVDVLLVVDDSGSMHDNQQRLSANLGQFIQVADFRNVDYRLGVTTTDVDGPLAGVLRGAPAVLSPGTSTVAAFQQRVQVGVMGSGWEQGLEAARKALTPPLVYGSNNGLLRDDAALAVVIVSDEDDGSPLDVAQYVDVFRGLKAVSGAPVVISAITGGATGCEDMASMDVGYPAPRYDEAVSLTGGIWASICEPDWADKLRRVGEAALLAGARFVLQGRPDSTTVTVRVNGALRTSGWTYDPASNAVSFDAASAPPPGATVTVEYRTQC